MNVHHNACLTARGRERIVRAILAQRGPAPEPALCLYGRDQEVRFDLRQKIFQKAGLSPDGFCSFCPVIIYSNKNDGGDLPEVRRATNNDINQAPATEANDTQQFLSLWEAPGVALLYSIRSTSPTAAAAMSATTIAEAELNDPAEHVCTVKLSAQLLGKARSAIELGKPRTDEKGDTNSYLVLVVRDDGALELHFPHSTSCAAASETVKKALGNGTAVYTLRLSATLLNAVQTLIDCGKCGLIVISELPIWRQPEPSPIS